MNQGLPKFSHTYSTVVLQIKLKLKFNNEISVHPKHNQYPEQYNMIHLFLEPFFHWITSLCPQNLPDTSAKQTHIQAHTLLHYKQLSTNFPREDLWIPDVTCMSIDSGLGRFKWPFNFSSLRSQNHVQTLQLKKRQGNGEQMRKLFIFYKKPITLFNCLFQSLELKDYIKYIIALQ